VIGFFPDVGASHFLNRLPGRLGVCAALTGTELRAFLATSLISPDAVASLDAGLRLRGRELRDVGLATHYVESSVLPILMERLESLGSSASDIDAVSAALREHEAPAMLAPPAANSVLGRMPLINAWFAGGTVEEIDGALAAAEAAGGPNGTFAASLRADMGRAAPTALKVSLEALTQARGKSLRECLRMEFRVVARFMGAPDFYEGVRAALLDKDGEPRWSPATLAAVTPEAVAAYFEPLPQDQELQLGPEPGAPPPRARM
jgi:enoyl-CoA hydratase